MLMLSKRLTRHARRGNLTGLTSRVYKHAELFVALTLGRAFEMRSDEVDLAAFESRLLTTGVAR